MLRRTQCRWLRVSCKLMQGGWGSAASGGRASASDEYRDDAAEGAGGWGSYSDATSSSGGEDSWGRASGGGATGWGNTGGGGGGGGWGGSGGGSSGGWGGASRGGRGGGGGGRRGPVGGGWGDGASGAGGGGWRGASSAPRGGGGRASGARGGRGGGVWGSERSSGGGGGGGGGQDAASAWGAAPPSFTPPVRRVDPLTLTAVEVTIDGVKKLVGQRVQITGLSEETSWQSLKDHLRQVAEVTFCKLYSGGRAMVEFTTPDDAARAITELQASELDGATLFLREDREDVVLVNTRRKIREAREAQLRARKAEAERRRCEQALAQGDCVDATDAAMTGTAATTTAAATTATTTPAMPVAEKVTSSASA